MNEEFEADLQKQRAEAESTVKEVHVAIESIQAAPDEVPTWEKIQEFQAMA
eukprot:CAMPEP_0185599984 /NCGR_PEP_ID=MMETSP0434-20130131/83085_1 /TAXON_ID=626734 ORGANISM="Favella taraikaensis, Strain Fe Narragansett Bay" /NCGR_SAMPLE_ID=MMETSP0434 /ASSEMBLY_ACC=CAM_ASM_000379 /LENGTH=50 /DNA_ID=CAMNT_0028229599 /DNA_START=1579 /DNA_END=1731 /DNA_ORIENTATION=+